MMRKTVSVWAFLIAFIPLWAHALGLGDIQLFSALNQPLDARIPLRALQSGDLDSLKVTLGSDAQFERAGLERPFHLARLRFKVVAEQGESGHLRVTTKGPVIEPFLNFLVDVSWSRGRVLREYTLLLDPPVYGAAIARTVKQTVPTVAAEPIAQSGQEVTTPVPSAAPSAASNQAGAGEYGPTKSTDTLWSLAERFRPGTGVSMQQMMLAMVRANPHAFVDGNVNTLRAGVVLRIPGQGVAVSTTQTEALAEVRRQHAAWEGYRQALAGHGGAMPTSSAVAEPAASSATSSAVETTAQPTEGEPELKLVSSGSAAQGVGGDTQAQELSQLREELLRAEEEADARARENESLDARLSEAETNIDDLQRLLELKEDSLAALQRRLAEAESDLAAVPAQPAAVPAEPVKGPPEPVAQQEPPKQTPPPTPPAPAPEPSIMDTITGVMDSLPVDPVILGSGLGGGLLVILGLVMWLRKRRGRGEEVALAGARGDAGAVKHEFAAELDDEETQLRVDDQDETVMGDDQAADDEDDDADVTQIAPAPANDRGDAPTEAPTPVAAQDDPLAEVNVYLAYERFDQAAELVDKAIAQYPDRHDYKLKMLEIHYSAKNVGDFEMAAQVLQAAVGDDDPQMETARGWWDEMSPSRALFADDAGMTDEVDDIFDIGGDGGIDTVHTPAKSSTGEGTVDFDLGLDDYETGGDIGTGTKTGTTDGDLDFDLGFGETEDGGGTDVEGLDTEVLDFSLEGFGGDDGSGVGEGEGTSSLDFDLDFGDEPTTGGDDTQIMTTTATESETEQAASGTDTEIDFDLDFEPTEIVAKPSGGTADGETLGAEDAELDFDLDFGTDEGATGEAESEAAKSSMEQLDTVQIDLDEPLSLDADEVAVEDLGIEPPTTGDQETDLSFDGTVVADAPMLAPGESTDADLGEDLDLDFDLEIPGGDEPSTDDPLAAMSAATEAAAGSEEGADDLDLDLDLGDLDFGLLDGETATEDGTGTEDAALDGVASGEDTEISLDLDADASLELDLGLGDDDVEVGEGNDIGAQPVAGLDVEEEFLDLELPTELELPVEDEEVISLDGLGESEPLMGDAAGDDDTDFSLDDVSLELDVDLGMGEDDDDERTIMLGGTVSGDIDEVQTKLDLARAYIDMQDTDGARTILEEVAAEGTQAQKGKAAELLSNIS